MAMKNALKYLLVLLLLVPLGAWAQIDPIALAYRAFQAKDYPKAKELIEIALNDPNYNTQAKAWYFGGFIYKDIYKQNRTSAEGLALRDQAVAAFEKSIGLDAKKEFTEDCIVTLKFLENTYYNDAASSLDTYNFSNAQKYYDQYRAVSRTASPELDLAQRDIQFKLFMASKYSILFDANAEGANVEEYSSNIIRLYEEVLAIDSNNVNASYNLATHYYNQGVNIIENMNFDLDFEELFAIQEKVLVLFRKALPHMTKAYKLEPTRKATLQGLSGIYYGLNDIEKSEYYQLELEKLGETGN